MSVPLRDKTQRGWHPEPNRMMSLAEHPQPAHRHAGLARAGRLWVGVQAKDWAAYLIRPGNTVTTQVEYEGVLRSCERLAEDNPCSDWPFLVDGFWWLGIRDAQRVLRDGEVEVHFLYPPEPAALHQQWPEVFPDADFLVMLGEEKKIQKADLLWLTDALRTGDQIDTAIGNSGAPGTVPHPQASMDATSVCVQGISLGAEWRR